MRWPPSAASAHASWNATVRAFLQCCRKPELPKHLGTPFACEGGRCASIGEMFPAAPCLKAHPLVALRARSLRSALRSEGGRTQHPFLRKGKLDSALALGQRQIRLLPGVDATGQRGDIGETRLDQPPGGLAGFRAAL